MRKLVLAAFIPCLGLAACAQPRDSVPIVVTHEGGRPVDVVDARARDGGRSAAAGATAGTPTAPLR